MACFKSPTPLEADEIEVDEGNAVIKECIPTRGGAEVIKNLDAFQEHSAATASATQNIVFDAADCAIVTASGDSWEDKTEECFNAISGVHTLYFILEEGVALDSWQFKE